MYWTLELASKLEDAPWPATREELIDYAMRSGAPLEVIENLQEMEDEGEVYECIEDIWPDYPSKEDFFFIYFQYFGDLFFCMLYVILRLHSFKMHTGRITVIFCHNLGHQICHFRQHSGCGRIIQIYFHFLFLSI